MTSYDGQTITYDAIGNPLKYRDNMSMKWNKGRQLTTLQLGLNTISYTYGEDGLRTKKLVNGLDSNYIRDDSGRLICYKTSIGTGHAMWFYYNPGSTTPDSIVFDGNRYIYFKNVQGDILGIIDKNGNLVAAYDYDSWGKCVHVYDGNLKVNTDYNFIGNINPLRYRGYEYDAESGLYYLQSRYYDPTTGRFVNADGALGANEDLQSNNLFAYCGNNPINCNDPTGESWLTVAGVCAAVVVVCGVAIVAAPALAAAGGVAAASSIASGAYAIGTAAAEIGIGSAAISGIDSIYLSKRSKTYDPDPYGRPGQKKQEREKKEKKKKDDDWKPNPNKRQKPPKHHTPADDHQKHSQTRAIVTTPTPTPTPYPYANLPQHYVHFGW